MTNKIVNEHRERPFAAVVQEKQRHAQIVPHADQHQNRLCCDNRRQQGQNDRPKNSRRAEAVHESRLVQLARNAFNKAGKQKDGERKIRRDDDQNQAGERIHQAQKLQRFDRWNVHQRRDEARDEQKIRSRRKPALPSRRDEGCYRRQYDRQHDREHRDDHTVAQRLQHSLTGQHLPEVSELPHLGPQPIEGGRLHAALERTENHHQHGKKVEEGGNDEHELQ